jgi:hypothetical protein
VAWKAPFRPRTDNGITQNFNEGEITIYRTEDRAQPGYYPQIELSKKVKLRYEERSLGIQRYYAAAQNQIEVKRVVRVPQYPGVTNQDAAQTEDGTYYRIDLVQAVVDAYPPCMDLTLAKYTQGVPE